MISEYIRRNVLGLLALFVALSGTAVAAGRPDVAPQDSVISSSIKNGEVKRVDIDSAQVQRRIGGSCPVGQSIRTVAQDGGITCVSSGAPSGAAGGDLQGTYPNPTIEPNAVTTNKIFPDAIAADGATVSDGSSRIASNAVKASEIANGAVATADIADNSLTNADIDNTNLDAATIGGSGVELFFHRNDIPDLIYSGGGLRIEYECQGGGHPFQLRFETTAGPGGLLNYRHVFSAGSGDQIEMFGESNFHYGTSKSIDSPGLEGDVELMYRNGDTGRQIAVELFYQGFDQGSECDILPTVQGIAIG